MEEQEKKQDSREERTDNSPYHKQPRLTKRTASKLQQHLNRGMTAFLVVAASIVFYFAFLRFGHISGILGKIFQILKPIIYGFVLAYLLNPLMKMVENFIVKLLKGKIKKEERLKKFARGVGIFTALLFAGALIVALCNMILPELYRSIRNMVYTVPEQLNEWMERLSEMEFDDSTLALITKNVLTETTAFFENWIRSDLLRQINIWISGLTEGVISVVNELMNIVIGIIVSVYVLFSKETFAGQSRKVVYAVLKPEKANLVLHITRKSNEIFGGFIIGKIIDSAIIGVLCFIGLSILDMPYTLLVSVIVGVTNVIPFFGPYIGAIPSAILLLLTDPIKGLYFLVFIIFLQQLDGNIIGPKILGDSTGLSAFWVVFSILLGGGLFGFVGMIMGVPTFAVIYYLFQTFINQNLEKKHLPTDSAVYDDTSYVDAESGEFIHGNNDEQNVREAQVRGKEDCEKEEEK